MPKMEVETGGSECRLHQVSGGDVDRCESSTSIRRDRHRSDLLGFKRVAIALPVTACNYAPTMDLFGSYFPAWMLCTALGIVTAVFIRQILAVAGINDYVVAPPLTYAALAVSATLLAWLLWFGH
jgi:hypothetical protein